MTTYLLGVGTGLLALPAGFLLLAVVASLHHGWWSELDKRECEACEVPDNQWSPIHRCPRCGRRQVRRYLLRIAGWDNLNRWISRGDRDEAWLNGDPR